MHMSTEENKAVVRRFIDEVWNGGKAEVIDEIIAADAVDHNPNPGQPPGSEGVKWVLRVFRAALPDLHMELHDQIAEGESVVSHWTISGTHQGDLFGIPATGKRVHMAGIDFVRVVDGKMVEHWLSADQLGLLQQLGVAPAPGHGG
jgi:steroid delta-isomerase-like uncharacterized protein